MSFSNTSYGTSALQNDVLPDASYNTAIGAYASLTNTYGIHNIYEINLKVGCTHPF